MTSGSERTGPTARWNRPWPSLSDGGRETGGWSAVSRSTSCFRWATSCRSCAASQPVWPIFSLCPLEGEGSRVGGGRSASRSIIISIPEHHHHHLHLHNLHHSHLHFNQVTTIILSIITSRSVAISSLPSLPSLSSSPPSSSTSSSPLLVEIKPNHSYGNWHVFIQTPGFSRQLINYSWAFPATSSHTINYTKKELWNDLHQWWFSVPASCESKQVQSSEAFHSASAISTSPFTTADFLFLLFRVAGASWVVLAGAAGAWTEETGL